MSQSRSFPDWLIKRDPTLAGAYTNPVFLAFEARRSFKGSGSWAAFKADPTGQMVAAIPLLFVVFGLLLQAVFQIAGSCCCFFIIGVFVARIVSHMLQKGKPEVFWVPSHFGKCIGDLPYVPVLRDLWMSPCTPREYAEALLLETRARCHISVGILIFFILGIVLALFVSLSAIGPGQTLSAGDYIFMTAFTLFTLCSTRFLYWFLALSHLSRVTEQVKKAAGDQKLGATILKSILILFAGIIAALACIFLLTIFFTFASKVWDRSIMPIISSIDFRMRGYDSLRAISDVITQDTAQVVWAGIFLILIPVSHLLTRLVRKNYDKRLAETMTLADEKIPIFFDRILER